MMKKPYVSSLLLMLLVSGSVSAATAVTQNTTAPPAPKPQAPAATTVTVDPTLPVPAWSGNGSITIKKGQVNQQLLVMRNASGAALTAQQMATSLVIRAGTTDVSSLFPYIINKPMASMAAQTASVQIAMDPKASAGTTQLTAQMCVGDPKATNKKCSAPSAALLITILDK